MLAGLGIYHWGRRLIPHDEFEKQIAKGLPSPSKGAGYAAKTVAGFLAAMVLFLGLLMLPAAIKAVIIIAVFAAIVFAINKIEGKDDKQRVIVLCILCVCTIAFWAIYEQQGGTLELWADQKTDLTFFGWTMPSSWYQSFNPLMIIAFAPFLDMYWGMQSRKGKASSSVRKMCIGSILCGLAFIIMIVAARVVGPGAEKGSILWLLITTWVFTMGELYLSPIGLSMVTKVAPKRMLSMMMGMWFLSSFIGNYMSGYLGTFYDKMPKDMFFLILCLIGVGVGIVFYMAEGRMKKVIGDV